MSDESRNQASSAGVSGRHTESMEVPALVSPTDAKDFNTFKVGIIPIACWRADDIRFAFGSSIVQPDLSDELLQLCELVKAHPGSPASVFGHADPVGDDSGNKKLSGRRATAIYALLTRRADLWEELYSKPEGSDNWGARSIQIMLDGLGFEVGRTDGVMDEDAKKALKVFQAQNGLSASGQADSATRTKLFTAYMDKLCGPQLKLKKEDFLGRGADKDGKGDYQGCSEFNPVLVFSQAEQQKYNQASDKTERNEDNAPNRRVVVLLFRKGTRVDPKRWPCPRAKDGVSDCKKRFWSDGEKRRNPQAKRREYKDTSDTYACRFYDRLNQGSPCDRGLAQPRLEMRWSKKQVTPDHNVNWPPKTPPTDDIPDEAKVEMLVTTRSVPAGTKARIEVRHAHTQAVVKNGKFEDLEVKNAQVVNPVTGKPPEMVFKGDDLPWDPYDKPFFYFVVQLEFENLQGETSREYASKPDKCLRVLYWHASISDAIADTPAGGGLTTQPEMREIAGILEEKSFHKVMQRAVNQATVPVNLWGSLLRNTYAYHHASHGQVYCTIDGRSFRDSTDSFPTVCRVDPDPAHPTHPGRSTCVLGNTPFGATEVNQEANVPTTPRYLVYIDTCVAGFEPSFGNALVARGTRNVIAFRKYIPDNAARQMARDFHRRWVRTHNCNPEKIPDIFFQVGAAHYDSMRPVLFGAGGGAITAGGSGAAGSARAISGSVARGAHIGDDADQIVQ